MDWWHGFSGREGGGGEEGREDRTQQQRKEDKVGPGPEESMPQFAPGSLTCLCSAYCPRDCWWRVEEPHCGVGGFPQGKRTNLSLTRSSGHRFVTAAPMEAHKLKIGQDQNIRGTIS